MTKELTQSTTELSTDLSTITAEINAYQRIAGEAIFEIGRRLKHVKEKDLAHGEWTKWLNDEVRISHEHARRFIKVFERFEKSTPVWNMLPNTMSVLYELTSFTDEQLEHREVPHELPSGETKKPEDMTVRELKRRLNGHLSTI